MYLTKIEMDRRSPSIQQALRDCEDMHRNVQKLFSDTRQEAGVLYTIRSTGSKLDIYILSEKMPDTTSLLNGMRMLATKNLSEVEKSFYEGKTLAFHLAAHPSKKVYVDGSKNSRRRFLKTAEQQIQWLNEKGNKGGFEIISVQLKEGGTIYSNKKKMALPYVEYTGYLRITNEQQFHCSWKNGIGPEKAYGLGMLLLK